METLMNDDKTKNRRVVNTSRVVPPAHDVEALVGWFERRIPIAAQARTSIALSILRPLVKHYEQKEARRAADAAKRTPTD